MKTEIQKFRTAARKIEALLIDLAKGEIDASGRELSVEAVVVAKAIAALDSRCNLPEIRGEDTCRAEAWATVSRLSQAFVVAKDQGFMARQAARHARIAELRIEERELAWSRPR